MKIHETKAIERVTIQPESQYKYYNTDVCNKIDSKDLKGEKEWALIP